MPDFGNPAGFDVATVLTGSGFTLFISAGIMRYGEQFKYTVGELYAISGAAFFLLGSLLGLVLIAKGLR